MGNKMRNVTVYPTNQQYELCENNPYINDEETESLLEPRQLIIPQDLLERAMILDKMNCTVRVICVCDVFMSSYYLLINYILGGVTLVISINGLLSTINYKKNLMCCYVYYQYFQVFSRVANIYYVINYSYTDNNANVSQGEIILLDDRPLDITIVSVLLLFQMIIAYFIKKYYDALPGSEDRERLRLMTSF